MSIEDNSIFSILATVFGLVFVYLFLFRKYIFSLFDPLVIYLISLAFSSVLVINSVEDIKYIVHFFVCQLFLFLGFSFIQKHILLKERSVVEKPHFYDLDLLKYTIYISFIVFVIANLLVLYFKGFALLADDPTSAKVSNFQEGFGIFRKINWGIGSFLSSGLIVLYLTDRKGKFLILLLFVAFFIALEGSKSSLLRIVLTASLLINHSFFRNDKRILSDLKKLIPVGFLAIASVLYTAFSKNSEGLGQTGLAFLQRMLYGADSVLYFYQPANDYLRTQYGIIDYISHVTNPILSFLRLSTYDEALGNIMVANAIPPGVTMDVIVGPNSPFYIEGQVYFGYYGAFLYSFLIGAIYSYCRQVFFALSHAPYFLLALGSALCFHAANILIESTLFITTCFDTCFFVIPIYIFVCIWVNGKLVIRKVRFNKIVKSFIPKYTINETH